MGDGKISEGRFIFFSTIFFFYLSVIHPSVTLSRLDSPVYLNSGIILGGITQSREVAKKSSFLGLQRRMYDPELPWI